MFRTVGEVYDIPEAQFAAFSALGGASGAFVQMYIDALSSAGVKAGLPRALAQKIACQATLGAQSGRVGDLLLHKNIPFPVRKKRDRVLFLEFCTNGRCLPHFSAAARNRQDFPALFYSFVTLPLPADACIAKTYLTTGLKAGMMASS